jgi:hypothetical protein
MFYITLWINKMNNEKYKIPQGLAAVAGNRDLITTTEFAQVFNVSSQTIRKLYCINKEAYGIKPTKIGSRLLWSVAKIAQKLEGII